MGSRLENNIIFFVFHQPSHLLKSVKDLVVDIGTASIDWYKHGVYIFCYYQKDEQIPTEILDSGDFPDATHCMHRFHKILVTLEQLGLGIDQLSYARHLDNL